MRAATTSNCFLAPAVGFTTRSYTANPAPSHGVRRLARVGAVDGLPRSAYDWQKVRRRRDATRQTGTIGGGRGRGPGRGRGRLRARAKRAGWAGWAVRPEVPAGDGDHSGHGHVYGHDLPQLSRYYGNRPSALAHLTAGIALWYVLICLMKAMIPCVALATLFSSSTGAGPGPRPGGAPLTAQKSAFPFPYTEKVLDNGLRIFVVPTTRPGWWPTIRWCVRAVATRSNRASRVSRTSSST